MNAEFNWWMLMVGLVVGAGLVWFVLADQRRREVDIDADERAREALWLSASLADQGHHVSPEVADRLLALHRTYLEAPPPDEVPPDEEPAPPDEVPADAEPPPGERPSELPGDHRRRIKRGAADLDQ